MHKMHFWMKFILKLQENNLRNEKWDFIVVTFYEKYIWKCVCITATAQTSEIVSVLLSFSSIIHAFILDSFILSFYCLLNAVHDALKYLLRCVIKEIFFSKFFNFRLNRKKLIIRTNSNFHQKKKKNFSNI